MRVTKNPVERRNEILQVAKELFLTQGYQKTTINDILKSVGIAKGTFYYYFQSKEEVMDAIIMQIVKVEVAKAEEIANNSTFTAAEKLFHIFMAESEDKSKESVVEQLHQVENSLFHQKSIVEMIRYLTPILTKIIDQGISEGIFHTAYPQESMELLLISGQFLFDRGMFQWSASDIKQKTKAFAHNMALILGADMATFTYIADVLQLGYEG